MFKRICKECDAPFESKRTEARFCTQGCRLEFNNRRRDRGADLYDAFMAIRYDRKNAKAKGVDLTLLCRIAEQFHAEDVAAGKGQTWKPTQEFIDEKSALYNSRKGNVKIGRGK